MDIVPRYADAEFQIRFNEAARLLVLDPIGLLDAVGKLTLGGADYRVMVTAIDIVPNHLDMTEDMIVKGRLSGMREADGS